MGGNAYPVTQAAAQGNRLTGKFEAGGQQYDFTATLEGDTLSFKNGNSTYALKRAGGPAPRNPLEQ